MKTKAILCALGTLSAIVVATAYGRPTPSPIVLYSDAVVGPGVTFSAGYDTSKFTLLNDPKLWEVNAVEPLPLSSWIQCSPTTDPASANCGSGRVSINFLTSGSPYCKNVDNICIVSASARPPAPGQSWRVRIELDLAAK
jgi:hypothetical protein